MGIKNLDVKWFLRLADQGNVREKLRNIAELLDLIEQRNAGNYLSTSLLRLVLLLSLFSFRFVLFLEEFFKAVDEALLAANHVQAAFLLVFLKNPVETLF